MTISLDIANVTPEQLDRCTRIWDDNKQEWFYQVLSESDNLTEYEVRFTRGRSFSCTCKAGQSGFHYCRSTCKHCRWAFAHAHALREERREQSQIESLVRQGLSRDEATRVVYANDHPFHWSEEEITRDQERYEASAFHLMR